MAKKRVKYNKSNITPHTRLVDLVKKKYHKELKTLISKLPTLKDDTVWWKVKKLTFTHPKSMKNYIPIADFIKRTTRDGHDGLNCSIMTFIWYLTNIDHSNLNIKPESAKALIYNMIEYLKESENSIF